MRKTCIILFGSLFLSGPATAGNACGEGPVAVTVRRQVMKCVDVPTRENDISVFLICGDDGRCRSGDPDLSKPEARDILKKRDGAYVMPQDCKEVTEARFEQWSDWPECDGAERIGDLREPAACRDDSQQYWGSVVTPTND